MKINKIIILVVLSCLIFGILFLLNKKENTQTIHLKNNIVALENYIQEIYSINPHEFKINTLEHNNDSIFPSIDKRLKHSFQLVLYIPEYPCQKCIIEQYEKLKSLPEHIQNNIIIMTSFQKKRDVNMWINSHKYKYPVYNNPFMGLTKFGSKNQLTLFIVDELGIPRNFYIATESFMYLSDDYYNFIIYEFNKALDINDFQKISESEAKSEVKFFDKHNFGTLSIQDTVSADFEFENISAVPFIIVDVKPDCGCTVAEWSHEPIAEGKTAKVKIKFQADSKGYFSKRITVFSNAKKSPHVLTISGIVEH